MDRHFVVFDTEIYRNYFLAAFKSTKTGQVVTFEMDDDMRVIDMDHLRNLLDRHPLVGFNSANFDIPIISAVLAGYTVQQVKWVADAIIQQNMKPWDIRREFGFDLYRVQNHIDLIEVAPLQASLKVYNGRLHGKLMQDLPIEPDAVLSEADIAVLKPYCINDLEATENLLVACLEPIELRESMGREYGLDLRSKSDAQVAEATIKKRVETILGDKIPRPEVKAGTTFRYQVPPFVTFVTDQLQSIVDRLKVSDFVVLPSGESKMPDWLEEAKIMIGSGVYRMGNGGLHSSEERTKYVADDEYMLMDIDVESYYPRILLNQRLFPPHIGPAFLDVYRHIYDTRVAAKAAKNKVVADSLKITINGTFGKMGSKWSVFYAPALMSQITITGQLCLLMLIERFEEVGITVISANTDGIVLRLRRDRYRLAWVIISQWMKETDFKMEETRYKALYSRDVNNYIAIKDFNYQAWVNGEWKEIGGKPGFKGKGAFGDPWFEDGKPDYRGIMSKNPANAIALEAAVRLMMDRTPIETTVRACQDIRRFLTVRTVKGGAVKDGAYLGKAIRWYYATGCEGTINYKTTGNKVPRSDGARPCMDLPDIFPDDIDYDWYVAEANDLLTDLGYYERTNDTALAHFWIQLLDTPDLKRGVRNSLYRLLKNYEAAR